MKNRKPVLWEFVMIGVLFSLIIAVPFAVGTKRLYSDFTLDDLETREATYQYYEEGSGAYGTGGDCKVFFSDADFLWVPRSYCSSEFKSKMKDLVPGTKVTMLVLDNGKNKDIVDLKANGDSILNYEECRKLTKRDRIGYDIITAFLLFPVWWALYKIIRREVIWWPLFGNYPGEYFKKGNKERRQLFKDLQAWLEENSIQYNELEYSESSEEENLSRWQKHVLDRTPEESKSIKRKKLIIISDNGKINLELDSCWDNTDYTLEDISFGDHILDMIDDSGNYKISTIVNQIQSVMEGRKKFIFRYNKKGKAIWWTEDCFNMFDREEYNEYNRQIKRINSSTSGLVNLLFRLFWFAPQKYEICDWDSYECVERK